MNSIVKKITSTKSKKENRQKNNKLFKYKTKIVFALSLLVILSNVIVAVYGTTSTIKRANEAVNEYMNGFILEKSAHFESWLNNKIGYVEAVSTSLTSSNLNSDNSVQNYFNTLFVAGKEDGINAIYFGQKTKKHIEAADVKVKPGFDPTSRPWYQEAKATNDICISTPYYDDATGKSVVGICSSIYRNGSFKGVCGVDIQMTTAIDMLTSNNDSNNKGVYIALLSDDNEIIYHPDGFELEPELIEKYSSAFDASQSSEELYRIKGDYDGQDKVVKSISIAQTGWKMIALMPASNLDTIIYSSVALSVAVCAIAIIVVIAVSSYLCKKNFGPLENIAGKLREMAKGNLSVSFDDIKAVSYEVKELKDSLTNMSSDINVYINHIGDHLGRVANCDVSEFEDIEYKGDYIRIKQSLQEIHENINDFVSKIKHSSNELNEMAVQSTSNTALIADSTTKQAAAIQEISVSVDNVNNTMGELAKENSSSMTKTTDSCNKIQETVGLMSQMSGAMDQMKEKSDAIDKIIKTIDDIAFQTNILALNAAVEAARAGSAGKGFAVVADEVRNLAQKSAEAAKNTSSLIEGTIAAIVSGEKITSDVVESINGVAKSSQNVADSMRVVTDIVNKQQVAVGQITSVIEEITETVNLNASNAEESSATADSVGNMANEINDILKKFKLEC